jgi:glycosyltransferase involved in cell wall biosynthesis
MACGCFPVAGDLESIREWITHRENGLLFDPTSPRAIADSILFAIENKRLRRNAAGLNLELIAARAEYRRTMQSAEEFYERVLRYTTTHSRL